MTSRVVSLNKRFCIALNYIISNEKVRVTELAKELKSKLKLKHSTSITYASRILSQLSDLGIIERVNTEYILTPRGWYYIYKCFEEFGYPEGLNRETLFERLRKEDKTAALLIPALEILTKIYKEISEHNREEISIEDTPYSEILTCYIEYAIEESEEPESWEDVLDLILPPLEEIPPTIFLNILKDKLKRENELTKAAIKDLLRKKAELLEKDASELKRKAKEIESRAQSLREIAEKIPL